ncbi:hypothetical protein POSPLADRAFT_1036848 [Postia placenta MAD-698-R-SB12]|uniref:Uncharacterized protein n=1 Tax=Postia placenta MAD-698-R-SB12 TaxID=670580 RepID=A0A1X6MMN9_9APHY|nr:hypothetical protein POSPLADRAFT_1036848 [Postia placenta MAD-698-R-SB12]OSX57343.1 hypothetical protein POSPLADRAFT_1036848 [Postia placenta MAD-698-R-SB12]
MYTLFLFLFMTAEFIPTLPEHLHELAKYALLFFIPLIVAANELGSFVDISYRTLGNVPAVGFVDQAVHTGFDVLTLALLVVFQLLVLAVAVRRLTKALAYRRELDAKAAEGGEVKTHLLRGLAWIVGGVFLGVVETAIGFAGGAFALAFARRTLRLLGRAGLIVGVINGVDTVEDFRILKAEQRRRSRLLMLISNPRNSTFRQVGGAAFDAEAGGRLPRALQQRMSALSDVLLEIRTVSIRYSGTPPSVSGVGSSTRAMENGGSSGMEYSLAASAGSAGRASVKRPQRVTVHYVRGRAPILELRRFSDLLDPRSLHVLTQLDPFFEAHALRTKSLPSQAALQGWGARRSTLNAPQPIFAVARHAGDSLTPPPSAAMSTASASSSAVITPVTRARPAYARHTFAGRDFASRDPREPSQTTSDESLEALYALTVQFPRAPRTVSVLQPSGGKVPSVSRVPTDSGHTTDNAAPDAELVPEDPTQFIAVGADSPYGTDGEDAGLAADEVPEDATIRSLGESYESTLVEHEGHEAELLLEDEAQAAAALPTPVSMLTPVARRVGKEKYVSAAPGPAVDYDSDARSTSSSKHSRRARTMSAKLQKPRHGMDSTLDLRSPPSAFDDLASVDSRVPRIMSVGSAPQRWTPTPTSSMYNRDSIAVVLDEAPVRRAGRRLRKQSIHKSRNSSPAERPAPATIPADRSYFED